MHRKKLLAKTSSPEPLVYDYEPVVKTPPTKPAELDEFDLIARGLTQQEQKEAECKAKKDKEDAERAERIRHHPFFHTSQQYALIQQGEEVDKLLATKPKLIR